MIGSWLRGISVLSVFVAVATIGYVQLAPGSLNASQSDGGMGVTGWPGHSAEVIFSAPGVTEPSSRTLKIFSEVPGTIREVQVKSGDTVTSGQLLQDAALQETLSANAIDTGRRHATETVVDKYEELYQRLIDG